MTKTHPIPANAAGAGSVGRPAARAGRVLRPGALAVCLVIGLALQSPAASARADTAQEVTVAVLQDSPPFSYQSEDGAWRGLAVEMWNRVAIELGLTTRFEGKDRAGLMKAVASGRARFGVGPLSITSDRLARVDFSIPIYVTGVAMAVPRARNSMVGVLVDAVLSATFLKLMIGLLLAAAIMGTLVWFLERRRNPDFSGPKTGLGNGIWFSIVTMTTVGYGDTAPTTAAGRTVAAVWMFASIVLISVFTGTVATLLTVERLGSRLAGFQDLSHVRVAAVTASAAAQLLEAREIPARHFPDVEHALQALLDGHADTLVFDRALLAAALQQRPDLPITILPGTARLEYYAFALTPGEPLRRQIDAVIARTLDSQAWTRVRFEYLGGRDEER
jgi:polar amino acid transport system substrate-binding protein